MPQTTDPIYKRWAWIIQAKFNPNSPDYYYGHKLKLGFRNFPEFKDYVESLPRPTPNHRYLHRINQRQGWLPGNLVWATGKQASNNHRHCSFITYQGHKKSQRQWAEELGMSYWTFRDRLRRGMTMKEIISTPNRNTKKAYAWN